MPINRRRRNQETPESNSSNVQQMMTLSLFIMLLAFFIVLNAISSYEEIKTEQVRRSVLMTFSKDTTLETPEASSQADDARAMKEGHAFDRLEALFTAQITGFEAVQSKSRGVMMVQVPYAEFKEAVMALGQKDLTRYPSRRAISGNFFLPTLVSILRSDLDGAPTRIEILLATKRNPAQTQNQNPNQIKDVINEAGVLSQKLEDQGMPQRLLNIGIEKADPEFVNLVFRKYVPFSLMENEEVNNGS